MRGKSKCKILKEIRQKIADENDIPYVTRECTYQGECSGTCPRCEAELRYLEQQLEKRQRLGKRVTVAALAASLMTGLVGCPENTPAEKSIPESSVCDTSEDLTGEACETIEAHSEPTESAELIGEVPYAPEETAGVLPMPDEYDELGGDIAYSEPNDLYFETTAGVIAMDETDIVEVFTEENDG